VVMKKTALIVVAIFAAGLLVINGFKGGSKAGTGEWAQEIKWTKASISKSEILAAAKPVFLFVHTEWCTYCRKMKSETFADPRVQQLLNDKFVALEINPETDGIADFTGEKLTYADLARRLRVNGYPMSFFFAPDGKLIAGQPGYIGAKEFADLAERIGSGHDTNNSF